ncbi:MAG TPA: NAD-dependent epimerase/dehydratase family protein [Blastocatellia bacterium]|nr:NAD-dependent epimerase/dehydratase family protein [Blastocatellia bacterium]
MAETVLLTGVAGFIPSHIADELIARGFNLIGVDDFSQGFRANIGHLASHPRFEFIEGDIRDEQLMQGLVERADYIVHAAVRGLASSVDEPMIDLDVNTRGTLILLRLAAERKIKRFVYCSSASVYGNASKVPESESDAVWPASPYAVSKLAGEQYALVYNRLYELPVVSLRYFNTYGPRQNVHSIYGGVVSIFIHRALAGEPLTIYGDGMQTRDFTYVADTARATADALTRDNIEGAVLNIGSGVETSVAQLAKAIIDLALGDSESAAASQIAYVRDRIVDNVARRCADIRRAAELLDYKPQFSLREGLIETIEWYRKNLAASA